MKNIFQIATFRFVAAIVLFLAVSDFVCAADQYSEEGNTYSHEANRKGELIAAALKKYWVEHGKQLPARMQDLAPKYIKPDLLWVKTGDDSDYRGSQFVIVPGGALHDPMSRSNKTNKTTLVAFLSNKINGARIIITSDWECYAAGEGLFQMWLSGEKMFK